MTTQLQLINKYNIFLKHVEAWNKLTVKQKFCVWSWLITEINILRCTVSKTSTFTYVRVNVVLCCSLELRSERLADLPPRGVHPLFPQLILHPYGSDGLIMVHDSRRIIKDLMSSNSFHTDVVSASRSSMETISPWKLVITGIVLSQVFALIYLFGLELYKEF